MKTLKSIYNSKWFPRILSLKSDGGKDSGVTAFFIIEWKVLFSIAILRFNVGTRDAYHSHSFNALTWWLKGKVTETKLNGEQKTFIPSLKPKLTTRETFHKVKAHTTTYALTFRDDWTDEWQEYKDNKFVTLTHGRKELT